MSLKFLHQVIIFAAISISLIFAAFCFLDPSTKGSAWYLAGGIVSLVAVVGLVFYEIHFLKKTRKLIIS